MQNKPRSISSGPLNRRLFPAESYLKECLHNMRTLLMQTIKADYSEIGVLPDSYHGEHCDILRRKLENGSS
jgi:hypothetical protein